MSTVELRRPLSGHEPPEVPRGSREFHAAVALGRSALRSRAADVRRAEAGKLRRLHVPAGFRGRLPEEEPRFGGGEHAWDVLASWDGWWYQQIAEHGYDPALDPVPGATGLITLEGNSAAFFPLYPALMRLVSECTGLGLFGAGLTVSVIASFVAALGIYAVTRRLGGHRAGLVAAGLWAVWPGSGTEWSGYSESLYTALATWACHAVLSRRWLTAGLLTCAAGLCRPTAAALIAALAVAALLSLQPACGRCPASAGRRGDRTAGAVRLSRLGQLPHGRHQRLLQAPGRRVGPQVRLGSPHVQGADVHPRRALRLSLRQGVRGRHRHLRRADGAGSDGAAAASAPMRRYSSSTRCCRISW